MFFHPLKHRKQLSAKHQYSGGLLALRGRQNMVWPALAIALFCILPACNRSDSDRGTDGDTGDIANDVANDTASANCQVGRNNPPTNDNNYLLAKVGARYYRINSTGSSGTLLSLPDGYYLYALGETLQIKPPLMLSFLADRPLCLWLLQTLSTCSKVTAQ